MHKIFVSLNNDGLVNRHFAKLQHFTLSLQQKSTQVWPHKNTSGSIGQ
jgi:hypothetical protein